MTNEEYKKQLDDDWDEFLRILAEDEEDEEDSDGEAYHDYVDEPYVDEDRLRRNREWEALGEWMSRR